MNIIFHKRLGRQILIAITGKQSAECDFCLRKVTEKNLGMIFKSTKDSHLHELLVCCNNVICLLTAEKLR